MPVALVPTVIESIVVLVIVPPVIATVLAFWAAIVPTVPTFVWTKAVVAIWVVLVPPAAVGAVGIPVKVDVPSTVRLPPTVKSSLS